MTRAVGPGSAEMPELPRREPYRTWLGSAVVFAVIVLLVGALVVVDSNTSGAEEVAPGTTVDVGKGVTFVPADGWSLVRENTTPGSEAAVAAQGGSFSVQVKEWDDSLDAEVERTRRTIDANSLRVIGDGAPFRTEGGLTGTRLGYTGPTTQGSAWVAVDDAADLAVVVFASSVPETAQRVSGPFDEMTNSIRMTGAGA
ncbi:hypothetical protein [Saccharothrix sp. HUAS TT1]|uniref:hypothetical protein n=1 Tax=unclassified Saccharothrix TaxID=2593673 RepID=UPI00345B5E2F